MRRAFSWKPAHPGGCLGLQIKTASACTALVLAGTERRITRFQRAAGVAHSVEDAFIKVHGFPCGPFPAVFACAHSALGRKRSPPFRIAEHFQNRASPPADVLGMHEPAGASEK